jgi:hypothetical protein
MVTRTPSRLNRRIAGIAATALLLLVGYQCVLLARSFSPWDLFVREFDSQTFREAASSHDDETVADQAFAADWYRMRGMPMDAARRTFGPPRRTEKGGLRWIWDLEIPGDLERANVTIEFGADRRLDSLSVDSLRTTD